MSDLLYKWFLGKAVGKIDVGPHQDPFFEEIPYNELGLFQRQGAKRKKPLPPGLSKNDEKILRSVRSRAYHLDLALSMCGFKFGWSGLIGLIPWIGDVLALYFALLLFKKAKSIDGGLPAYLQTQMTANIAFDFGIGLIPIVGDLINIAYKANSRNCIILEKYLKHKAEKASKTPARYHDEAPVGNASKTEAHAPDTQIPLQTLNQAHLEAHNLV